MFDPISVAFLVFSMVTNCVFQMTCFPTNPLDVFDVYTQVYGIPNAAVLGIILGIIIAALYLHSRNLAMLAVTSIYSIAAVAALWESEPTIQPEFDMVKVLLAMAVASVVVIFVLKILRE